VIGASPVVGPPREDAAAPREDAAAPRDSAAAPRDSAVRTVISAWSAVSPFGLQSADFATGLRERRGGAALNRDRGPAPVEAAWLVPGFDAREVLGRKGTRSMDRVTALAVAATEQLLRGPGGERIDGVGNDTALVLGTNISSAQSIMDFTRDTFVQDKPYFVDPARFPNVVLNCAAARCAIWHRLQGPNATISGGRASGLLALSYARRLQRSGRAGPVLCGAAEEFSVARAWLQTLSEPDLPTSAILSEGCAMVLLEPAGRPAGHLRTALAELLALEFGVYRALTGVQPALADCLDRAFAAAHESPARLWAVISSGGPNLPGVAEDAALTEILGDRVPVRHRATDLVGDVGAASASFGLTAVLALAAQEPAAHGRTALLTAVDRDGVVGCGLLRLICGAGEQPS